MAGWEIQKSFIMYPKDWNTLEFTKSSQMALSTRITDDCYLSFINTSSEMNTENKKKCRRREHTSRLYFIFIWPCCFSILQLPGLPTISLKLPPEYLCSYSLQSSQTVRQIGGIIQNVAFLLQWLGSPKPCKWNGTCKTNSRSYPKNCLEICNGIFLDDGYRYQTQMMIAQLAMF